MNLQRPVRGSRPKVQFLVFVIVAQGTLALVAVALNPDSIRFVLVGSAIVVATGLVSTGAEWALRGTAIAKWFIRQLKHE